MGFLDTEAAQSIVLSIEALVRQVFGLALKYFIKTVVDALSTSTWRICSHTGQTGQRYQFGKAEVKKVVQRNFQEKHVFRSAPNSYLNQ